MAREKAYYWIKVPINFFDDPAIDWISDQKNGNDYIVFYLRLCLKSANTGGVLIRNVGDMLIPYDVEKLAEIGRADIDTAAVALKLFEQVGLIEVLENKELYLTAVKDMVGSETAAAHRQRIHRDKKAALVGQCTDNVTQMSQEVCDNVTQMSQEVCDNVTTEKEIEIEKEKDKKEKRGKRVFTPPTLEEVQAYCRERGNSIDPQYFLDYYTSTGWMRGKVKLKDWKAAVRTWERQDAKWQGQTDDRQQGASAPGAAAPAENNALANRRNLAGG